MSEFSLINKYCRGIGAQHLETRLSVGDDAAVLAVPAGKELVVSVDTMVEGVHFFAGLDPQLLAHKLLAVNLSDMAAMGAQPKWATLALTLPEPDTHWLQDFSAGLDCMAAQFDVELIGGDTTKGLPGALTLTLQIMGLVDAGSAITRTGAQIDDLVLLSNTVGDAALALKLLQQPASCPASLRTALEQPHPQISLGSSLHGIASAAIDVSDGLVADLAHIAKASKVSIELDASAIPLSTTFITAGGELRHALYGGDDYQLAFTAAPQALEQLLHISSEIGVPVTVVGRVIAPTEHAVLLCAEGETKPAASDAGYQHF